MNLFKNLFFATILFVGFSACATDVPAPKTENIQEAASLISRVVTGVKNCVWDAPTTFMLNNKLATAAVVVGITAAVVAAYVLNAEEEAEEVN